MELKRKTEGLVETPAADSVLNQNNYDTLFLTRSAQKGKSQAESQGLIQNQSPASITHQARSSVQSSGKVGVDGTLESMDQSLIEQEYLPDHRMTPPEAIPQQKQQIGQHNDTLNSKDNLCNILILKNKHNQQEGLRIKEVTLQPNEDMRVSRNQFGVDYMMMKTEQTIQNRQQLNTDRDQSPILILKKPIQGVLMLPPDFEKIKRSEVRRKKGRVIDKRGSFGSMHQTYSPIKATSSRLPSLKKGTASKVHQLVRNQLKGQQLTKMRNENIHLRDIQQIHLIGEGQRLEGAFSRKESGIPMISGHRTIDNYSQFQFPSAGKIVLEQESMRVSGHYQEMFSAGPETRKGPSELAKDSMITASEGTKEVELNLSKKSEPIQDLDSNATLGKIERSTSPMVFRRKTIRKASRTKASPSKLEPSIQKILDHQYENPLFQSVLSRRRSSGGSGLQDQKSKMTARLLNISEGGGKKEKEVVDDTILINKQTIEESRVLSKNSKAKDEASLTHGGLHEVSDTANKSVGPKVASQMDPLAASYDSQAQPPTILSDNNQSASPHHSPHRTTKTHQMLCQSNETFQPNSVNMLNSETHTINRVISSRNSSHITPSSKQIAAEKSKIQKLLCQGYQPTFQQMMKFKQLEENHHRMKRRFHSIQVEVEQPDKDKVLVGGDSEDLEFNPSNPLHPLSQLSQMSTLLLDQKQQPTNLISIQEMGDFNESIGANAIKGIQFNKFIRGGNTRDASPILPGRALKQKNQVNTVQRRVNRQRSSEYIEDTKGNSNRGNPMINKFQSSFTQKFNKQQPNLSHKHLDHIPGQVTNQKLPQYTSFGILHKGIQENNTQAMLPTYKNGNEGSGSHYDSKPKQLQTLSICNSERESGQQDYISAIKFTENGSPTKGTIYKHHTVSDYSSMGENAGFIMSNQPSFGHVVSPQEVPRRVPQLPQLKIHPQIMSGEQSQIPSSRRQLNYSSKHSSLAEQSKATGNAFPAASSILHPQFKRSHLQSQLRQKTRNSEVKNLTARHYREPPKQHKIIMNLNNSVAELEEGDETEVDSKIDALYLDIEKIHQQIRNISSTFNRKKTETASQLTTEAFIDQIEQIRNESPTPGDNKRRLLAFLSKNIKHTLGRSTFSGQSHTVQWGESNISASDQFKEATNGTLNQSREFNLAPIGYSSSVGEEVFPHNRVSKLSKVQDVLQMNLEVEGRFNIDSAKCGEQDFKSSSQLSNQEQPILNEEKPNNNKLVPSSTNQSVAQVSSCAQQFQEFSNIRFKKQGMKCLDEHKRMEQEMKVFIEEATSYLNSPTERTLDEKNLKPNTRLKSQEINTSLFEKPEQSLHESPLPPTSKLKKDIPIKIQMKTTPTGSHAPTPPKEVTPDKQEEKQQTLTTPISSVSKKRKGLASLIYKQSKPAMFKILPALGKKEQKEQVPHSIFDFREDPSLLHELNQRNFDSQVGLPETADIENDNFTNSMSKAGAERREDQVFEGQHPPTIMMTHYLPIATDEYQQKVSLLKRLRTYLQNISESLNHFNSLDGQVRGKQNIDHRLKALIKNGSSEKYRFRANQQHLQGNLETKKAEPKMASERKSLFQFGDSSPAEIKAFQHTLDSIDFQNQNIQTMINSSGPPHIIQVDTSAGGADRISAASGVAGSEIQLKEQFRLSQNRKQEQSIDVSPIGIKGIFSEAGNLKSQKHSTGTLNARPQSYKPQPLETQKTCNTLSHKESELIDQHATTKGENKFVKYLVLSKPVNHQPTDINNQSEIPETEKALIMNLIASTTPKLKSMRSRGRQSILIKSKQKSSVSPSAGDKTPSAIGLKLQEGLFNSSQRSVFNQPGFFGQKRRGSLETGIDHHPLNNDIAQVLPESMSKPVQMNQPTSNFNLSYNNVKTKYQKYSNAKKVVKNKLSKQKMVDNLVVQNLIKIYGKFEDQSSASTPVLSDS